MKYATLLLGLAIVLASIVAAQAADSSLGCTREERKQHPTGCRIYPRERTKAVCEKYCKQECELGHKLSGHGYWFCESPK